ncbi:YXWGXW repeat-containing protein [Frigoriglobus tundricola]|uniref:YXWGXW repeat-containing protein n=1 Tax=Frigoriglobus tundricola TaxID=2774151 RepID=UPI00148EA521|nr:YXWGXW repeat-containing protein [Frigoriglobus tundricola]
MPRSHLTKATALFAVLTVVTSARAQDPLPVPLPRPPAKPENVPGAGKPRVTVVESGPVHEGFAQPGAHIRGRDITAPTAPPPPVDEIPPDAKLEGTGIRWVPGYWHWDADRNDFIWVCGCHRNVPPECAWEPGLWKQVRSKWTYFPGYWRPTGAKSVTSNLPEPPAPKGEDPTVPPGNGSAMWVPGYWERKDDRFVWCPGYWPPSFENMIWLQGQYVATVSGFVFVPGHWDYPLEERGVLFAPMYFSRTQREKRGWSYRPEYAISFGTESKWGQGGAFDSLDIGPGYNNYFYGARWWWDVGGSFPMWDAFALFTRPLLGRYGYGAYQPWYTVARGYTNPLWQHYLRLNRNEAGWVKNVTSNDPNRPSNGFLTSALSSGGTTMCLPRGVGVAATSVRPNHVTNTQTWVQPAGQVVARQSARVISTDGGLTQQLVTKNTLAYQYVSRHGNLKTGVIQYRSISPPVYTVAGIVGKKRVRDRRVAEAISSATCRSRTGLVFISTLRSSALSRCCPAPLRATPRRHSLRSASRRPV